MFGTETFINLWGHALLGDRILLIGSQLNALTIVAETIVGLLYPLKWTGAYVPVLPYPALTLVHAPMSWILGVEISSREETAQQRQGKYSKRRRSNVAVIIDRVIFISLFLFYCLLLNHSFQINPNSITNCFKLILFYLQLYNYIAPASLLDF